MNPPQRGNHQGRGRRPPFYYRRNWSSERRPRPVSVPIPNPISDDHSEESSSPAGVTPSGPPPVVAFQVDANSEQYPGWNLYFPEECI